MAKRNDFTDIYIQMDKFVEDYKTLSEEIQTIRDIESAKIKVISGEADSKVVHKEDAQKYILTQIKILSEMVPQKESKTQSKVSLLSGDIVIKKPKQTFVADKQELIRWAQEQARLDLVDEKVVQTFRWKEYKETLEIVDGQAIDTATGEVVAGVTVEDVVEEVVIK